jgi:electron transfer flavoprotein alpha subunit
VDSGWVPPTYQVGLTGKTITPDLYITVAISGASQHMAGCSGAKVIVAINRDSEANIFKEARYGVVGDWEKVLPAFTETVRELIQS